MNSSTQRRKNLAMITRLQAKESENFDAKDSALCNGNLHDDTLSFLFFGTTDYLSGFDEVFSGRQQINWDVFGFGGCIMHELYCSR